MQRLDRGEAEAIALAEELKADRILIDEDRGRKMIAGMAEEKKARGEEAKLQVDTTLAILTVAALRELIDIENVVAKLRSTTFRVTEELYRRTIENVRLQELARQQERKVEQEPEKSPTQQPEPGPEHKPQT